jgi:predicted nucleotidyltransferase
MIRLIQNNMDNLKTICSKHSVAELYLFGSAVSCDFGETSDLDFAVLFKNNLTPLEHGDAFFSLKDDLENLFLREIDLISYRVIKNPIFKSEVDRTKISLYAA